MTLKGSEVDAVPVNVPPPVFWTVKFLSAEFPRVTLPKSWELGVTEITGAGTVVSIEPRPPVAVAKYDCQPERMVSILVMSALCAVVPPGIRRMNACFQVVVGLTPENPLLGDRAPSIAMTWLRGTFWRVPETVTPFLGAQDRSPTERSKIKQLAGEGFRMKKKFGTSAAGRRPIMY